MIVVRHCRGFSELAACVRMEVETWGYDPTETLPKKAFHVAQFIGGQVIGAFDTSMEGSAAEGDATSLVGFAFALPGVRTDEAGGAEPFLHSHMLAVLPAYRNSGLGQRLKLAQRADALARGIRHMQWTFDPLEIKNAYLNMVKLGATACRYQVDFYGVSSSRLQAGLPTDRLVADWKMDSARVAAIISGTPQPVEYSAKILVPAGMAEWKAHGDPRALAVQQENRQRFEQAFAAGRRVVGFERDAVGNGYYLLH